MLTQWGWVQVRKLAAEVYGAHEQNGEWNDEGEWHVVGDEDLESSDDDLLGSDIESSSNDDDHDGDMIDLAGDESSGDDYDSADGEFEDANAYQDALMGLGSGWHPDRIPSLHGWALKSSCTVPSGYLVLHVEQSRHCESPVPKHASTRRQNIRATSAVLCQCYAQEPI